MSGRVLAVAVEGEVQPPDSRGHRRGKDRLAADLCGRERADPGKGSTGGRDKRPYPVPRRETRLVPTFTGDNAGHRVEQVERMPGVGDLHPEGSLDRTEQRLK